VPSINASLTLQKYQLQLKAMEQDTLLAQPRDLVLSLLESCLELIGRHLKVLDVGGCTIKQRNLARLLVGHRESVLESAIPLSELVSSPLF
jgi:hypothetical protein